MAFETIFSSALFVQAVFPFLLVFTLIFAVLDKSKLLGEGKRQINAIVSLVISLIFITFGNAVGIVVRLMPVLVVLLVIILVFYLMLAFVQNDKEGFSVHKGIKVAGGILVFAVLVIAVLVITGFWSKVIDFVSSGGAVTSSILLLIVIGGALAVVLSGGKNS